MIQAVRDATRPVSFIHVALALLGLLGTALVIYGTSLYGTGVSPDSVVYLSTAENLRSGNGYLTYLDEPLVSWPPLFSTLIAGLGLIGIAPSEAARFLNAFAFGFIVFIAGQLFRINLRSNALVILGTCSVLLSWPLVRASTFALAETLFTVLAILFVVYMPRLLNEKRLSLLIIVSGLVALIWLQRYAGIMVFVTGFVSIAFLLRQVSYRKKFNFLFIYTLIAAYGDVQRLDFLVDTFGNDDAVLCRQALTERTTTSTQLGASMSSRRVAMT